MRSLSKPGAVTLVNFWKGLLGNSLFKTENYEQALAAYDKVISLDEKRGDAWYNKAIIYEGRQQIEQAIEAYKKAYAVNPSDASSYAALKRLNVSIAPPNMQAKSPRELSQGRTITTDEVNNFRVMCGDPLPNNPNLFPVKLYPVYVNYNEKTLRRIKLEMCGDASPTTNKKLIQVASFTSLENAERFKGTMIQQFGSGTIGQPVLIKK